MSGCGLCDDAWVISYLEWVGVDGADLDIKVKHPVGWLARAIHDDGQREGC